MINPLNIETIRNQSSDYQAIPKLKKTLIAVSGKIENRRPIIYRVKPVRIKDFEEAAKREYDRLPKQKI